MKKIIFLCLATILCTGIFATPVHSKDASEKVMKIFLHDFPEVTNPTIHAVGNYFMIYFKNEDTNSSCRVYYDADGKMLQTIKYYSCADLSPFIRAKINARFKGKDISSVTEVTNSSDHYYQIVLKDSKSIFIVNSNVNGSMYVEKKFRRA